MTALEILDTLATAEDMAFDAACERDNPPVLALAKQIREARLALLGALWQVHMALKS
jgi:hypothetical protein